MRPINFHLNYMLGGLMVNAAAHIVVRKSRPSTLDADLSAGQLLAFVLYVYGGEARPPSRVLCNKSNRSECVPMYMQRDRVLYIFARAVNISTAR
jgi:hypothetical protein